LNRVFRWLVDKGNLYHFDEYGMLYIHAGIKNHDTLDIGYFDGLQAEENRFKTYLTQWDEQSGALAIESARIFRDHLEMREYDWLHGFIQDGKDRVFDQLAKAGLRGVVYGHTPHHKIGNSYNRFFNADLSMSEYYGGLGGALLIGLSGVHSYRFLNRDSSEIHHEELMSGEDFRDTLLAESKTLVKSFRQFFAAQSILNI